MSSIPPNQINYFRYIQLPINMAIPYGDPISNNVYTPTPQFEMGIADRPAYDYYWIYIVGCMVAFGLAMANGANDVANSFATSVGSRAIKMKHAMVIASVMEFLGAYLLGGRVTDTIRSKVATTSAFAGHDDVLMFGMLCAMIVATTWIFFATFIELPVSITHSTIGSIVGFAVCANKGVNSVDWNVVGLVVASWFISPSISAIIAFSLFTIIRKFVLRTEYPFSRALKMFPLIVALTFWVNALFIIFKGGISDGKGLATGVKINTGEGFGIAFACAAVGAVLTVLFFNSWASKSIGNMTEEEVQALAFERGNIMTKVIGEGGNPVGNQELAAVQDASSSDNKEKAQEDLMARAAELMKEKKYDIFDRIFHQPYVDAAAYASNRVVEIQAGAEIFDMRTEILFGYLQIFTACFAAFSHGSNDVANSAGPISAIVAVYLEGTNAVLSKNSVPDWVLLMCCAGLVVGLALFGHYIIAAMGNKLVKITPSRGFCAELSFSFVVVFASFMGIPVSTTQCIVGALFGIGAAESKLSQLNWFLFGRAAVGWVATLVLTIASSALLFSFSAYAPSLIYPLSKVNCMNFYGKTLNTSAGDPSSYTLNTLDGSLNSIYGYPSTGAVYAVQPQRRV